MHNPYKEWEQYVIGEGTSLEEMCNHFTLDKPLTGGFDTESTGLHIIKDKPFLLQFGWLVPNRNYGKVYVFYPTKENMKVFLNLAKKLKYLVAHNIKYDLHMLTNIGYGYEVMGMTNLVYKL
jgi:DNA polymerase I